MSNFKFPSAGSVIVCSLFLVLAKDAAAVDFKDCGSTANVTSLTITGCQRQPCIFAKGRSYNVTITAVGVAESKTLPYKVTTKILYVPVTLLKGDACNELAKGTCPVEKGEVFAYEQTINVKNKYPSVKAQVKALVVDDNGNTVICLSLAVKLK